MRLDGARIIVIDDHQDLADNLREILEEEGATVRTASSAAEGVRVAGDTFDVALVDVQLPDARGPSIVPQLKAENGLQEVLLVTGHASIQDAVEAVKAGAFAYVLKPFDSEELVATVERAYERVRMRQREVQLQAAIEHREAALRTLVDTVQALLLVLDEHHVVTQANPAVAHATGVPLKDIVGSNWIENFVPARDRERVREVCHSLHDHDAGASSVSSVIRRGQNGELEERSVNWRWAALNAAGQTRIYASGLDVTELRDLERRTRLAEKLAAVGTIAAGLAHEIRNPLNAASLQLQLLERRLAKFTDDPKLHEPVGTVQQEIIRLSHLVSDFLAFARPQALNVSSTDLGQVIRHVGSLITPLAEERAIRLDIRTPAHPIVVDADGERLKQVLLNLVRNAMDAVAGFVSGPGQGYVEVRVEPDGAGARLVVADNGPGIPPDIEARMFEPFFTTKEEGTGLGMAIAHKIIDMHGGQIRIGRDGGAVFTITLPRRAPRPLR